VVKTYLPHRRHHHRHMVVIARPAHPTAPGPMTSALFAPPVRQGRARRPPRRWGARRQWSA
jgi:hypothetical protein